MKTTNSSKKNRKDKFLNQEKLKTLFISDVTHELRTPLAIIKGNVELALRNKSKNHSYTKTFKAINTEVNHLAEMLSDLTTLTSENQNFHKKVITYEVNLQEVISSTVERLKAITVQKNITIHTKELPCTIISGDETYLNKLFSNIIKNAIFYNKKDGNIDIRVKKNKKDAVITITDDGIGIPKKDLPNIFDRFYRATNARVVNREGTGLGLAISKWVVEAHNGTINVTSEVNKGTKFTITLPLFV